MRTKGKRAPVAAPPETLETAFEATKPYRLTALGAQFVTYVMSDSRD